MIGMTIFKSKHFYTPCYSITLVNGVVMIEDTTAQQCMDGGGFVRGTLMDLLDKDYPCKFDGRWDDITTTQDIFEEIIKSTDISAQISPQLIIEMLKVITEFMEEDRCACGNRESICNNHK